MLFLFNLNKPKVLTQALTIGVRTHDRETDVLWRAQIKQKKSNPKKISIHLSRQHLLKLFIFVSLAGMLTHSLPAKAGILDPIRRVFPQTFSSKTNTENLNIEPEDTIYNETENTALDGKTSISQTLINNEIEAEKDTDTELAKFTSERPSLFNVMQAEFLANRGEINTSLELYKQESFKQDSTSVFERALELSLLYEPPSESLQFAYDWQQMHPEHIPALFYVAHLSLKAGNYDLASETLSEILKYDPQADLSEILQGIYPTDKNDQRLLLETVINLPKHNNPSILVMQAGLLSQLGLPEIALISINRALKVLPYNSAFIVLKADILKQIQPDREVLKFVSAQRKRIKDSRIKDSKALYLYEIKYFLELGQTQEAWELLLKAHDLFHDDELTLLAALVSIDIQAYEEADDLLSGLASSPYYIDKAYYYLGISAERQQKLDRAERFLSKVMQENLVLKARQKLVAIQVSRQQFDRALDTLSRFSEQFEVYAPESAIMQADILRQLNKFSDAKKVLEVTNKKYPDDTKLLFARTKLLDNENDKVLKKELLNRLILLDPENPDYKTTLAVLLFETGNVAEIKSALNIAQSVVDMPYDSPLFKKDNYLTALNILAADALSEQRYDDVINQLESTYEISPTLDSGILLLRAYQGLNQEEKVIRLFNDIQNKFALGKQDLSDRLQLY